MKKELKETQKEVYRDLIERINHERQQVVIELLEGEAVVWYDNGEMEIDSLNFRSITGRDNVDKKVEDLIDTVGVKRIYMDAL